jgi:hypothetical protein
LERIHRVFVSMEWEALFSGHELISLLSLCSDHTPLLLKMESAYFTKKRFIFHSFWPSFPGFREVMERAWRCPLRGVSTFQCLDWLLWNSAHMLKSWSHSTIGSDRMQLEIGKELLHQLEMARDQRVLAPHEESLRQLVKLKSLGLMSHRSSIARQEARLLWSREGDASTTFFHAHTNSRHHLSK